MVNVDEEALKMHKDNQGKSTMMTKVDLRNGYDLSLAYTLGVAEPCRKIYENKDLSFEYTCRGNIEPEAAIETEGAIIMVDPEDVRNNAIARIKNTHESIINQKRKKGIV